MTRGHGPAGGFVPPAAPRRGWFGAFVLAVVVGLTWAAVLFVLIYFWYFTIAIWLATTVTAAAICFVARASGPRSFAYGVGLLMSIPVTVFAVGAILILAV